MPKHPLKLRERINNHGLLLQAAAGLGHATKFWLGWASNTLTITPAFSWYIADGTQ